MDEDLLRTSLSLSRNKSVLFLLLSLMTGVSPGNALSQWKNGILLRGTICTMDGRFRIIEDGHVLIAGEKIVAVLDSGEPLPAGYENAVVINTNGCIYPGLMDLHNHPAYNLLPLWTVPRKYTKRYQWPNAATYKTEIRQRYDYLWKEKGYKTITGIYVEVKALAGGTTTIQGFPANRVCGRYMVRNTELSNFGDDQVGASVMKLETRSRDFERTRTALANNLDAWFYHLAEGSDSTLRAELSDLQSFGLNLESVVGIHCTALRRDDFHLMSAAKMKMVWSPLSNLLLYGHTSDVRSAKEEGILICLGSDWSPSGSKNILWELKVAHQWNETELSGLFTPRELVQMVTTNPAQALKWEDKVGSIKAGMYADVIVTAKLDDDPYMNLIDCTEKDVRLVIIGGEPYYGDVTLMQQLKGNNGTDDFEVLTDKLSPRKAVDVTRDGLTEHNFMTIFLTLKNAMGDSSFPVAPISPDPIYTGLDPFFFSQLWSVAHNTLNTIQLAAAVYPIGETLMETRVRTKPGGRILVKLGPGKQVIITGLASGRRMNWHEVLARADDGRVYLGVVSTEEIEIVSQPR